ncbi:hypothetical protein Ccrd_021090 [Cynara cardunculus var. scolymus]|uniref:Uncharacterized protein n=1 Tax=Cynara cardunculus var. scolymus TaxID=59895 RepID=A0A118K020_CYNCS|nr:hypothetical protein Ccrd_021090 [Cynara cardunculus var. scolymus]
MPVVNEHPASRADRTETMAGLRTLDFMTTPFYLRSSRLAPFSLHPSLLLQVKNKFHSLRSHHSFRSSLPCSLSKNSTGESLVDGIGVAGSKASEGKLLQVVLVSPQWRSGLPDHSLWCIYHPRAADQKFEESDCCCLFRLLPYVASTVSASNASSSSGSPRQNAPSTCIDSMLVSLFLSHSFHDCCSGCIATSPFSRFHGLVHVFREVVEESSSTSSLFVLASVFYPTVGSDTTVALRMKIANL